ncbi:MAG: hypothetical protein JXQ90_05115 [Cyclobacteriaceae bacterium]
MKQFVFAVFFLSAVISQAQWKSEDAGNPFDGQFKKAFVTAEEQMNVRFSIDLKKENELEMYLSGITTDDCTDITVSLNFDNSKTIYNVWRIVIPENGRIVFGDYFFNDSDSIFTYDFIRKLKTSSEFWMRIENGCNNSKGTYKFSLKGSGKAINYVVNSNMNSQLMNEKKTLRSGMIRYNKSSKLISESSGYEDILIRTKVSSKINGLYSCPVCSDEYVDHSIGDSIYVLNHFANNKFFVRLKGQSKPYYMPNVDRHIETDANMSSLLMAIRDYWSK